MQIAKKTGEAMNRPANFLERREHPRGGVMAELEDLAYGILRKHGVVSGPAHDASAAEPITMRETGRDTTMANLRLIVSNDQPEREEYFPPAWLLYKDKDLIQIYVGHDNHNRPFVFARGAE